MLARAERIDIALHEVLAHILERILKQDVEILERAGVPRVFISVLGGVHADLDFLDGQI